MRICLSFTRSRYPLYLWLIMFFWLYLKSIGYLVKLCSPHVNRLSIVWYWHSCHLRSNHEIFSPVMSSLLKSQDIFNLVIMTSLIQSLHLCSSHAYIFAPVMISFPSRVSRVPHRFSGFFQRWIKSTQCKFHIPFIYNFKIHRWWSKYFSVLTFLFVMTIICKA